jgi:hypothetical protein
VRGWSRRWLTRAPTPENAERKGRELAELVDARAPMSPAEREEQRRNAVHGNVGLEYPSLTRAEVDAALNKHQA